MLAQLKLCIFFLFTLFYVFNSSDVKAYENADVSITARVPLTGQHIAGIQKNSVFKQTHKQNVLKKHHPLEYHITLTGLKNLKQINKEITLVLTSHNNNNDIKTQQTTNEFGAAIFEIPVSHSLHYGLYKIGFYTVIEETKIDLFEDSYIFVIKPLISQLKKRATSTYIIPLSPLEKIGNVTYSVIAIFATLKWTEKTYGFVKEILVTPAAFIAAARDGPVVICGACQSCD